MLEFGFSSGRVLKYNLILHGAYFFFASSKSNIKGTPFSKFRFCYEIVFGKIDFDPASATVVSCTIPLQIKFSFREL